MSAAKDTIREFNLNKAQLAFTVSKKVIENNGVTQISYAHTTIFSDELTEPVRDPEPSPTPSICHMHKYAPRKGSVNGGDEVLIYFTNKIKRGKYGGKITIFLFFFNLLPLNRFTSYIQM